MKLPFESVIAPEKLRDYLLKPRDVDDKSGFLRLGGYDVSTIKRLERDIRELLAFEAEPLASNEYVEKFLIRGALVGPSGRSLRVCSVWAKIRETGEFRFVTLYPDHK